MCLVLMSLCVPRKPTKKLVEAGLVMMDMQASQVGKLYEATIWSFVNASGQLETIRTTATHYFQVPGWLASWRFLPLAHAHALCLPLPSPFP